MPGLPAMVLGIIAYCYLDDRPGDADWLSPFEQLMVEQDLERDEMALGATPADDDEEEEKPSRFDIAWGLLRDPAISLLAVANLLLMAASYTLMAWTMQRWSAGLLTQTGWLALVPGVAGIAGMIAIGYDSDRRHERRGHFIACMVLAAGGLGLAIVGAPATGAAGDAGWSLAAALVGLSLASLGVAAAAPLLVSILTDLLTRQRAAIGIALVGGAGALGGVFGPALGARLLALGGGAVMLAVLIVMVLAAGAALLLALRLAPRRGGRDARLSALAHMG
jgi:predicted MFS family arabinose efflux permease